MRAWSFSTAAIWKLRILCWFQASDYWISVPVFTWPATLSRPRNGPFEQPTIGETVFLLFPFILWYAAAGVCASGALHRADKDWLHVYRANRTGTIQADAYDVVFGPVANDQAIRTVNNYLKGYFSEEIAIQLLLPQKLKDQYAFRTEKALSIRTLWRPERYEAFRSRNDRLL